MCEKGMIFTILNIDICKCGDVSYDVGINMDANEWDMECDICGAIINDGVWWVDPKLFAPIVEDEFLSSDKIEKIVEEKIDIEIPVEA